jgi:hypothetical protein
VKNGLPELILGLSLAYFDLFPLPFDLGFACYARGMIESSLETNAVNPDAVNAAALVWEPEEFVFGLQYAGRPAGTIRWLSGPGSAGPDREHWLIRVETNFTGVLGAVRRVQVSKLERATGLPVSYIESDGGSGRAFETTFDRKTGLVTVHQHRDVASVALTQDYLDPVSVLQMLRTLSPETSSLRVPMVGGTVLIARLPDEVVQAPWGEVNAHVFYLRPGIGLVYIEADAPHRILKLGQTVGKFMLEGWLMRSGVPQVLPSQVERGRETVQQPRSEQARAQVVRNQGPRARMQEGRRNRPERGEVRPQQVRAQAVQETPSEPRPDQARMDQPRSDQARAEGGSRRGNRRRRRNENRTAQAEAGTSTVAQPRVNPPQQNTNKPEAAAGNETPRKRRRRRSKRGNARGSDGGGEGGES